jgi:hypothetical protein
MPDSVEIRSRHQQADASQSGGELPHTKDSLGKLS